MYLANADLPAVEVPYPKLWTAVIEEGGDSNGYTYTWVFQNILEAANAYLGTDFTVPTTANQLHPTVAIWSRLIPLIEPFDTILGINSRQLLPYDGHAGSPIRWTYVKPWAEALARGIHQYLTQKYTAQQAQALETIRALIRQESGGTPQTPTQVSQAMMEPVAVTPSGGVIQPGPELVQAGVSVPLLILIGGSVGLLLYAAFQRPR